MIDALFTVIDAYQFFIIPAIIGLILTILVEA